MLGYGWNHPTFTTIVHKLDFQHNVHLFVGLVSFGSVRSCSFTLKSVRTVFNVHQMFTKCWNVDAVCCVIAVVVTNKNERKDDDGPSYSHNTRWMSYKTIVCVDVTRLLSFQKESKTENWNEVEEKADNEKRWERIVLSVNISTQVCRYCLALQMKHTETQRANWMQRAAGAR